MGGSFNRRLVGWRGHRGRGALGKNLPRAPADCSRPDEMQVRHEIKIGHPCPGHAVETGPGRAQVGRLERTAQGAKIEHRRRWLPIDGQSLAAQLLLQVAVDLRPSGSVTDPNVKEAAEVWRLVVTEHKGASDGEVVVGVG